MPNKMEQKIENRNKVTKFVKDWMNGHEPGTFIRNEHGTAIYSAGPSSLNLESFFEELLLDYQETLTPPKEISDCDIEKMAKEANYIQVDLVIDEEERYYRNFLKYDGFIEGFKKCQSLQSSDTVGFAEWIKSEGYEPNGDNKWERKHLGTWGYKTSKELYDQYKLK